MKSHVFNTHKQKYLVQNEFLAILIVILICLVPSTSSASCASCPKNNGAIEGFVDRISEALLSENQNVVLVRTMSKNETDALLDRKVIPSKELRKMLYSGHVLTGFKVIDSLNQSSQVLIRFAEIGNKPRRSPEGFAGPFVPNEKTEWLLVTCQDSSVSTASTEVSVFDLKDQTDGILSAKPDNRLGINVASLMRDLKSIKSAILAKEELNPLDLKTGIGRAILNTVTINKEAKRN